MNKAKIRLSPKEMSLVNNPGIILTKNKIIKKARLLLELLQEEMVDHQKKYLSNLPPEIINTQPKISRGENYEGLPYLILDYPRYFNKENILAIRTMLWWGNFFSITLHLSGKYKTLYQPKIIASYPSLKKEKYFICINNTEWEHHFEKKNYVILNKLTRSEYSNQISKGSFIKLAQKIPLEKWDDAQMVLLSHYKKLVGLLV